MLKPTHPILCHAKRSWVHSQKQDPLLAVAIATHIALVCLCSIGEWVVDVSDRGRERDSAQLLALMMLDGENLVAKGDRGTLHRCGTV